jgi:hypothetical protein
MSSVVHSLAGSNIDSVAFLQRSVARDARQLQWRVRFAF